MNASWMHNCIWWMNNEGNAMKNTRDNDDGPTGQSSRNMGEPKPSPFCLWQSCYYHTRNKLQWRVLMLSRLFMWKISVFSCNTLFVISIGLYAIVEKKRFFGRLLDAVHIRCIWDDDLNCEKRKHGWRSQMLKAFIMCTMCLVFLFFSYFSWKLIF